MDPNLNFRFSIPGWTALLTVIILAWAAGALKLASLCGAANKDSLAIAAAVLLAVLGAPAVGFLLNTVVVTAWDVIGKGPVHCSTFSALWGKCTERAGSSAKLVKNVFPSKKDRNLASLMAHFEYKLDGDAMLEWRRRQRAAFFGNYANALAILVGMSLSVPYWWDWWACPPN